MGKSGIVLYFWPWTDALIEVMAMLYIILVCTCARSVQSAYKSIAIFMLRVLSKNLHKCFMHLHILYKGLCTWFSFLHESTISIVVATVHCLFIQVKSVHYIVYFATLSWISPRTLNIYTLESTWFEIVCNNTMSNIGIV